MIPLGRLDEEGALRSLYTQNIDILVAATWDYAEEWVASIHHIARE